MSPYEALTEDEKKKMKSFDENQPFSTVVGRLKEDQLVLELVESASSAST